MTFKIYNTITQFVHIPTNDQTCTELQLALLFNTPFILIFKLSSKQPICNLEI